MWRLNGSEVVTTWIPQIQKSLPNLFLQEITMPFPSPKFLTPNHSQPDLLVSLHVIHYWKGSPIHKLLGKDTVRVSWERRGKVGEKEGHKIERSSTPFFTHTSACFSWHSCGWIVSFLNSDNETQKRRTGQRMPHKGAQHSHLLRASWDHVLV